MRSMFEFELDDQLFSDEPTGWDSLVSEITRDFSVHGLLTGTKATLTFTGDMYAYLKCVYDSSSFCSEVKIKIYERCNEGANRDLVFNGLIKSIDLSELLDKCTISAPVQDNSFYARINNNKSIKAFPHVGKSKNGFDITPASAVNVKLFDPVTGTYPVFGGITYRKSYRLFELLKFIIAFVSDDEIDFASDLLDTGEWKDELITNGKHISTGIPSDAADLDIGSFSFQEAIDEVYKIGNIGFFVDLSGPRPLFRVEDESYFYGQNVTDILQFANGVVKKVKQDQLYARIGLGSDKLMDDAPAVNHFPERISFTGFNDEEFHLIGNCNTDTKLDLKGNWIRSSNVIEFCFMNPDTQGTYDADFVFVSAEDLGSGNYRAKQYDIFGNAALPYYYNGSITNDQIVDRFFGAVPSSIASFLGGGNDQFEARLTGNQNVPQFSSAGLLSAILAYNNDYTLPNVDPNNNYGNGTTQGLPVASSDSFYTIPRIGLYSFSALDRIEAFSILEADASFLYTIVSGVFILGETVTDTASGATGILTYNDGTRLYVKKTNSNVFGALGNYVGSLSGATANGTGASNENPIPPRAYKGSVQQILKRLDSTNTFIEQRTGSLINFSSSGIINPSSVGSFICNATDRIRVAQQYYASVPWIIVHLRRLNGCYFGCTQTSNGGGIYKQINNEDFKSEQYVFEYPVTYEQFKRIKANPMDKLGFNIDGLNNILPWIEKLTYHHSTKSASITLLGKGKIFARNCRGGIEIEETGGRSIREDGGDSLLE